MASSNAVPPSNSQFQITQEQFNSFHSIDRQLFTRLLYELRKDAETSFRVMGLFLWLERLCRHTLVDVILKFSPPLLRSAYNEAVWCLKAVSSDTYPFEDDEHALPVLTKLTRKDISLRFFHDHREDIQFGLEKNLRGVCALAFRDIIVPWSSLPNVPQAWPMQNEGRSSRGESRVNAQPSSFSLPAVNHINPFTFFFNDNTEAGGRVPMVGTESRSAPAAFDIGGPSGTGISNSSIIRHTSPSSQAE